MCLSTHVSNTMQPYAPISHLSGRTPSAALNEEIKLYETTKQREFWESLAEIYSIIVALDKLERAFLKDSVASQEYTPICLRLLAQYNTILKNTDVAAEFVDLDTFMNKYHMSHPHARQRLEIGVPATVENQTSAAPMPSSSGTDTPTGSGVSGRAVAEATGAFITTMDGLKLGYKAKDQLHPLLSELMTSVNRVTNAADFDGRAKIVQWLIKLNQMKVNEELSEEDVRQLLFDLDNAYKSFYTTLQ